jgi:hypothetical protein
MTTEDNEFEVVPTLWFAMRQWQQEAIAGAGAPEKELAASLDKIALVVPSRTVARALKKAAEAARGTNSDLMMRELEAALQSVERYLPDDYFPELWKLVAPGRPEIKQ